MIVHYLLENAAKHPDKLCIVDKSRALTYQEMVDEISKFSSYLVSKNVKENDRILLCLPNCCELLVAYCSIMLVGATTCFVDHTMKIRSIQYIIDDLQPDLIITIDRWDLIDVFEQCENYPEEQVLMQQPEFKPLSLYSNETAVIMYTSGTTGKPKGVKISHDNIEFTANSIIKWANITPDDRELTTLPLTHSFGLGHFHCYAMVGGTMYIETGLFDVNRIINTLENVTSFPLTPSGVKFLLRYYKTKLQEKTKNLKYIIINTAPMPVELTEELLDTLPNTQIYIYYGLTEASRSTYLHCNRNRDKLGSVGIPPEHVKIKINVNHNSKLSFDNSKVGEILISGRNVAKAYLHEEKSSLSCNEWLRTGDIGYLDDNGFLYVTGRVKEMINIDGLKVSPYEIEAMIGTFPGINDVAVVGVPDDMLGEKIVALVVVDDHKKNESFINEVILMCLEKTESFKVPKHVLFVSEIPRDKGKTMRRELVALYKQQFGIPE